MSSISTISAGLYQQQPLKGSRKTLPEAPGSTPSSKGAPQDLASSIMADGGLGFLRSRMEEKLGSMFPAAEQEGSVTLEMPSASSDVSPQATASRIVGFALNMMDTYKRQNNNLNEQELQTGFEAVIRQGIEDGFGQARDVLGTMELLEGQVSENVTSTWDMVQEMLDDHFRDAA